MSIFISYRRDDSIVSARLLHNELVARFGADHVFMDIGDIGYGEDFARVIAKQLDAADVVVVVIGPKWAQIIEQRLRGDDWVRLEVATALRLHDGVKDGRLGHPRIVPVLVGGAAWPGAPLPEDIAGLQGLNALKLDEGSLLAHVNALVEAIKQRTFEEEASDLKSELSGRRRTHLAAALIGVVVFLAAWIALFDFFGLDTRLAAETMQLAQSGSAAQWSGDVVLVGIDEASEDTLGRPFGADWRAEHARIVDAAAAAGARALAFDVLLEDPGPPRADAALAAALAAHRTRLPVIFGVQRIEDGKPRLIERVRVRADWGIACAGVSLGRARTMPLAVQRVQGATAELPALLPSLALAAFSGGGAVEAMDAQSVQVRVEREQQSPQIRIFSLDTVAIPQSQCPLIGVGDRVAKQLIDPQDVPALRVPPRRVAYEQVLRGDADAIDALRGRIVLVGVQKAGQDQFTLGATGDVRWGVELVAAQIDALVRGVAARPLGGVATWLLMSALAVGGAAIALALRRRPAWWRAAAVGAAAVVFGAATVAWYYVERQLIGFPYGLAALVLGAWAAARLMRKETTR